MHHTQLNLPWRIQDIAIRYVDGDYQETVVESTNDVPAEYYAEYYKLVDARGRCILVPITPNNSRELLEHICDAVNGWEARRQMFVERGEDEEAFYAWHAPVEDDFTLFIFGNDEVFFNGDYEEYTAATEARCWIDAWQDWQDRKQQCQAELNDDEDDEEETTPAGGPHV